VVSAALLALGLLSLFAPAVLADSWPQDGSDPYQTGCAATGWLPYAPTWTGNGWLQLDFSSGCTTAWAQFTCASAGGCQNFTLWAKRWPDGKSENVWVNWPSAISNGATVHTAQLFDGGAYTVQACEQRYFWGYTFCTPLY
jgi:hypothetical protein